MTDLTSKGNASPPNAVTLLIQPTCSQKEEKNSPPSSPLSTASTSVTPYEQANEIPENCGRKIKNAALIGLVSFLTLLVVTRKTILAIFQMKGFSHHAFVLSLAVILTFAIIQTIACACVTGKSTGNGLKKTLGLEEREEELKKLNKQTLWEKRGKTFGSFLAYVNILVFAALAGYGTYDTFKYTHSWLMIAAVIAFTLASILASWFFAKPRIEKTFASFGERLNAKVTNKKDRSCIKTTVKIICLAIAAVASAPLLVLGVNVPLKAALINRFGHTPFMCHLSLGISILLVAVATTASFGLIYQQFNDISKKNGKLTKLREQAKAKGKLGSFYINAFFGGIIALGASMIPAVGSFFGMHALYPVSWLAWVVASITFTYFVIYNFASTTAGVVKGFNWLENKCTALFKAPDQSPGNPVTDSKTKCSSPALA